MPGRPQRRGARGGGRRFAVLLAGGVVAAGCGSVSRVTLHVENDVWNGTDRQYTNGERVTALWDRPGGGEGPDASTADGVATAPASADDGFLRDLVRDLDLFSPAATTQYGVVFGQEFYTPDEIRYASSRGLTRRIRRNDRPFAGWLYVGGLWAKAARGRDPSGGWTGDHVFVAELDLGATGPSSFADATQISYHHMIGSDRPQGWDDQIGTQMGVHAVAEWRHRLASGRFDGDGGRPTYDVLGRGAAEVGNVVTAGTVGVMVRAGSFLPRNFGPNTIHASAVDVPLERAGDARTPPAGSFEAFAAADVSAVAHNVFLDGRLGGGDEDLARDRFPFVAEARIGFALQVCPGFRASVSQVFRTKEFLRQDDPQRYLSFAFVLDF